MKYTGLIFAAWFFVACEKTTTPNAAVPAASEGEKVNLSLYEVEEVEGSSLQLVLRRNNTGKIIEEGFVKNGVKTGTWVTYHEKDASAKTIASYIDGVLNGIFLEMDRYGRLLSKTKYKNGVFHGEGAKYSFARTTESYNYKNGKLDGIYRRWYDNTGELQMEAHYKDGELHGKMTQYNKAGGVIIEYVYENGMKVE
ncbi:MAG: hypothetical protein AAGI23_21820 [Bacteroidota bacterium]